MTLRADVPIDDLLLAGGGEMGARMRAFDWPRSTIGPTSTWPHALRTCVRLVLASHDPAFLWWGRDLVNLYNDAHAELAFGRHVDGLGQPARLVWRALWDEIGPSAESALRGERIHHEPVRLLTDHDGFTRERYVRFVFDRIEGETSGDVGLLGRMIDCTDHVIADREHNVLRDLVQRTGSCKTSDQVWSRAIAALAAATRDVPFALLYAVEPTARMARLAECTGIRRGNELAPERIRLRGGNSPWPIESVLGAASSFVVVDLNERNASFALGPWSSDGQPPTQTAVVPIVASTTTGPAAILVLGLSPFRRFDDRYRSFVTLVAAQIGGAVARVRALSPPEIELVHESDIGLLGMANAVHAIFEQAPVALALFEGSDHRIVLFNDRAREVARLRRKTIDHGVPLLELFPELAASATFGRIDRVFHTGEPVTAREELVEVVHDDGSTSDHYFTIEFRPTRAADTGKVMGVTMIGYEVTDAVRTSREREHLISEREHLAAREKEARMNAESASRAKDEFLAMLGHELRNPLAPIVTALHLMRLRSDGTSERERKVIERQVKHLVRLVDDLLDISRITRGKLDLKKEPVEIATVVANGVDIASPLFEQRRHHLEIDVPTQGLVVEGDVTRLSQVIANLLTNAAKYTTGEGHVSVTAAREDGDVVVRVRDDGMGISAETLPHVFDLFVQERQALDRSLGGLGLGLSIVRSLVELHGGAVAAKSDGPGRGSEFVVRLPSTEDAPALVGARRSARPGDAGPREGTLRVLVVDDNLDACEMLRDWLDKLGNEVRVAHDGLEALDAANRFSPDIVILDIGLPVWDGYEVARRLRERRGFENTTLIAVTGYGQPSDRERSRAAGFDAHFVKPVDLAALRDLLESPARGRDPLVPRDP